MKSGAKGEDVRALQEALIALGYELPRWGADGSLGSESIDALAAFLRDHGVEVEDDASEVTKAQLALVKKVLVAQRGAAAGPTLLAGKFHDLRSIASQDRLGGRRAWSKITGVTLHQTAVVLGERPERWKTLGAHLGVTREGQVVWLHDFAKIVWHANGLNAMTVGIELDGMYEGVQGDLKSFWNPDNDPKRVPQRATNDLVEAAKATVRWVCSEVERHGGKVNHLYAHRQASKQRQSDPGSELWHLVGMALHKELTLTDGGAGFTLGDGLRIPEAWDPSRKGVKY